MTKVFDTTEIKGNEKLLMLSLADFSNDSGVCFPSYNTLTTKTSMNKGSVAKWLKSLEDKGYLLKAKRKRKSGANSSNKYLLFPIDTFDNLDEEDKDFFNQSLDNEPSTHSLEVELASGLEVEPAQSLEVKLQGEPSLISLTVTTEPSLTKNGFNLEHVNEWFSAFWEAYPKKKSKEAAKKAFTKHFKDIPVIEDLLYAVNMQSLQANWKKDNGQFIPHPATWLNAHGWEDEVMLSDYEKSQAIQEHTGMDALEQLRQMGCAK